MVQVAQVDPEDQGDLVGQGDPEGQEVPVAQGVQEDLVVLEDQGQCHLELQTGKQLLLGFHLDDHMVQGDQQDQADLGGLAVQEDPVVLVDLEDLEVGILRCCRSHFLTPISQHNIVQ